MFRTATVLSSGTIGLVDVVKRAEQPVFLGLEDEEHHAALGRRRLALNASAIASTAAVAEALSSAPW